MTDTPNPDGSTPDPVLEPAELEALPLLVTRIAGVCSCGCLDTEHGLNIPGTIRTVCFHGYGTGRRCPCIRYTHTRDRYSASTYVTVPAGAPAPELVLRDHRGRLLAP